MGNPGLAMNALITPHVISSRIPPEEFIAPPIPEKKEEPPVKPIQHAPVQVQNSASTASMIWSVVKPTGHIIYEIGKDFAKDLGKAAMIVGSGVAVIVVAPMAKKRLLNNWAAPARELLTKLTGAPDIAVTTRSWGWFLYQAIEELDEDCMESIVLIIAANIIKKHFADELSTGKQVSSVIVMTKLLEHALELLANGFNDVHKKLQENPIIDWKESDARAKAIFAPFSRAIFDLLIEDVWSILNPVIPWGLSEISDVLIKFYRGVPKNNNDACLNSLREKLWKQAELAGVFPRLKIPEKPTEELSRILRVEEPVDIAKQFCDKLGVDTVDLLIDYFAEPDQLKIVLKAAFKGISDDKNPPPLPRSFYQAGSNLLKGKSSSIPLVKEFFSNFFDNVYHNLMAQLFKGLDVDPTLIPVEVVLSIFAICTAHFPSIISQFNDLKRKKFSEEELDNKKKEILLPIARALHKRLLPHLSTLLPLFDHKKERTAQLIVDNLLTFFLQITIHDLTRWINQKERNIETIYKITGKTHAKEWIKVMNQWIMDFFPYFLEDSDSMIAKLLIDTMGSYLPNKANVQQVMAKNIHEMGAKNSEMMNQFWDGIRLYVDAAMTKFSALFVSALQNVDKINASTKGESVMEELGLGFIKLVREHFQRINSFAEDKKVSEVSVLKHPDLLDYFQADGKGLHPALTNVRKKSEEELATLRKENFFKPFVNKFIEFIELEDLLDLPFPKPLNTKLWVLTKEHLLPIVFERLFEQILDPMNINIVFLNMLSNFEIYLKQMENDKKFDVTIPQETCQDPNTDFDRECGEMILQLLRLAPNNITRSFFRIQRIKEWNADKAGQVGKLFRDYLKSWNLLDLLDQSLVSGVPALHAGEWKGLQGQERFVPHQLSPTGKRIIGPQGNKLAFNFERMDFHGKLLQGKLRAYHTGKKTEQLQLKLAINIKRGLQETIRRTKASYWTAFRKGYHDKVERYLGTFGLKVKAVMDKICHFVFVTIIGNIFRFPMKLFDKIFWFFMEIYIKQQAKGIVRSLHMPIHQNLIYFSADMIMDVLLRRGNAPAA